MTGSTALVGRLMYGGKLRLGEALALRIKDVDPARGEVMVTGPDILRALGRIQQDHNTQAPHSALGMRAPIEYREALAAGAV